MAQIAMYAGQFQDAKALFAAVKGKLATPYFTLCLLYFKEEDWQAAWQC